MRKKGLRLIMALMISAVLALGFCLTACGPEEKLPEEHSHNLQKVTAAAPTCTEAGNIEYWVCKSSDCGKYFSDAEGKKEITDKSSVNLAEKGHSTVKVEAKAATCTEAGVKEHYKCSVCGDLFTDSAAKTSATADSLAIPATGHTASETWIKDDIYHWKNCVDGHNIEKDKDYHTLAMTLMGGKREFLKYEALDVTGMTASLSCSVCGFAKEVGVTDAMVTGYDRATAGEQTLTVKYNGKAGDAETEVSATYTVTVAADTVKHSITLENAWYSDNTTTSELEYNAELPAGVKYVTGNTFVGWYDRVANAYYGNDDFTVTGDATLTAVYAEDLTTAFTPACVLENGATGEQAPMEHETAGDIKATKFAIEGDVSAGTMYKILNGEYDEEIDRTDACENGFPLSKDHGSLMVMTFNNNGTAAVKLKYQVEFWGVIGEIETTVSAGETKDVPLLTSKAKNDAKTAFHQLVFPEAVTGGVSLTVYGRIYTFTDYASRLDAHSLTLRGATFADGKTSGYFAFEADALDGAVLAQDKTFLGWADEKNKYYADGEFTMPETDTVLCAVYKEDLAAFTPSCCFEAMAGGAKTTMDHETVDGVKATKCVIAGGVTKDTGYKILNNDGTRPDNCENLFPIYGDRGSFALMTFVNNGATDLAIKYQSEYWGVRGEVTVNVPAGQSKDALMICTKADSKADTIAAFSQLYFTEAVTGDISLTIYGRTYDPMYYEKQTPHTLTFRGATYGGETEASLTFGAALTESIVTTSGKTLIAWKTPDGVYDTTEKLIAGFKMGAADAEITAYYAEDLESYKTEMTAYTPSCVFKDKSKGDSEKKQGAHNDHGSTTYMLDSSVASWIIYDGADEAGKNDGNKNNALPLHTGGVLIVLQFTNDSGCDIAFDFGNEFYGMKKLVSVELAAGETKTVYTVSTLNCPSGCFKEIDMTSCSATTVTDIALSVSGWYI